MCWACYTPLTAGASMGATAPRAGAAPKAGGGKPGAKEDEEKKKVDPKIFVVGGVLAVGAIAALFMSGIFGGSGSTDSGGIVSAGKVAVSNTGNGFTAGSGGGAPVSPPPPPPPPSGGGGGGGGGTSAPPPPSYSMIGSPSPRFSTATFGIAPSQPVASAQEAYNLAETARQQLARNGKWTGMQIVVFTDTTSGQAFNDYMTKRRGQPLASGDYSALAQQNAWQNATIFYEVVGSKAHVSYPSKNPEGWWGG